MRKRIERMHRSQMAHWAQWQMADGTLCAMQGTDFLVHFWNATTSYGDTWPHILALQRARDLLTLHFLPLSTIVSQSRTYDRHKLTINTNSYHHIMEKQMMQHLILFTSHPSVILQLWINDYESRDSQIDICLGVPSSRLVLTATCNLFAVAIVFVFLSTHN